MPLIRRLIVALGLIAIAAAAVAAARANPLDAASALVSGALGNPSEIAETLVQTTSLLFPALGVALAFRAGLFNIGAEGQLVMGGLAAGLVGVVLPAPAWLALPALLGAGAVAGGAWGAIAGVVRGRFGGSEVVATLMLNFIAASLANYLVTGPLRMPGAVGSETPLLAPTAWLPALLPETRLTIALPIGIALALLLWFVFARTVFGYELRAAGLAPEAARRAGIRLARIAFVSLSLSGALAGLGGATIVSGVLHRFDVGLSPGYGFIAIAVALVGGLEPLGIVVASFAFGILQSGSLAMQALAHVPKDAVTLVEGLAIVALAARRRTARAA